MWNRRDWDDFFNIVRKPGSTHRPPRPVDLSRRNRLVPTEGYSLAELDDAGLSIEKAEFLGLPVDAARVGSYGPNGTNIFPSAHSTSLLDLRLRSGSTAKNARRVAQKPLPLLRRRSKLHPKRFQLQPPALPSRRMERATPPTQLRALLCPLA